MPLKAFNAWRSPTEDSPRSIGSRYAARGRIPTTTCSFGFRYLYLERVFTEMIDRLKPRAGRPAGRDVAGTLSGGGLSVGPWSRCRPPISHCTNPVLPTRTVHHPERCLAETMGMRYRCKSADDYRKYYLPLLARKRGEGQRFHGLPVVQRLCEPLRLVSRTGPATRNSIAGRTSSRRISRSCWPEPLETPTRDVLLVFFPSTRPPPSRMIRDRTVDYEAVGCSAANVWLPDVPVWPAAGGQAFGGPDGSVPAHRGAGPSSYLTGDTVERLKATRATVRVSRVASARRSMGRQVPSGATRAVGGLTLHLRGADRPVTCASRAEHFADSRD